MATAQPKPNRRYEGRTIEQLHDGDVFTLTPGVDSAVWHTATGMTLFGNVVVEADGGGTVRIPATPGQECLVEVDYVKVAVQVTMVIDVAAWACEYGLDRADVEADARAYFAPTEVRENFIPAHLRSFVAIKGSDQDPLAGIG
jgi:hypothetical protein